MQTKKVKIPAITQHAGMALTTVKLNWVCPVCGKPRGDLYSAKSYDGSRILFCDGWLNVCGHIDKYDDVVREAVVNGLNSKQVQSHGRK